MTMIERLKKMNDLTNSEATLVNYILHNTDRFLKSKPDDIAKHAYVSVSTLYRLVEKLGLNGVVEFKLEIANALQIHSPDPIDVNYPETGSHVLVSLSELYAQTHKETFQSLNLNDVKRAALALYNAKQVTVYNASSNVYFAQNFQFQLQEIGISINVPLEDYMQRLHAANSSSNDFAIVVSYGGRSDTSRKVVGLLKESKTPYLLITSSELNSLRSDAAYVFTMYSEENHFDKISSFSSRLSLLTILDSLYACVFDIDSENNLRFKRENYKKMNPSLK